MLAVDTNVIVRYLTGDDAEQFAKASALIRGEDVYVSTTVLLETEWVLRGAYRFGRERISAALAALAGLPRVTLEDPASAAKALDWTRRGMDFADALHLAKAERCDAFVSFDQHLAAVANGVSVVKVRLLLPQRVGSPLPPRSDSAPDLGPIKSGIMIDQQVGGGKATARGRPLTGAVPSY